MKWFNRTLSLLATLFIVQFSFGQSSYQVQSLHDTLQWSPNCDSNIFLSVACESMPQGANGNYLLWTQGQNFSPGSWSLYVDWGDGTSSYHNGQSSQPGQEIQWQPWLGHSYPWADSTYNIHVTFHNPSTQDSASADFSHTVNTCSNNFYGSLDIDCDANGSVDSTTNTFPLRLTNNANGNSYLVQLWNGSGSTYNLPNGTYSVEVDSAWLFQNNYTAHQFTPSTLTINNGSTSTYSGVLHCANNMINHCSTGRVFCDNNANGIYDAGDQGIANAELELYHNGLMFALWTDANGEYQFNGTSSQPADYTGLVCVKQSWLTQNGYVAFNACDSIYETRCNHPNNNYTYLAINCGTSSTVTGCLSGQVFCDANDDNHPDSTDMMIPNAPVDLWIGGNHYQGSTDQNGYYNITYTYNPSTTQSGYACVDSSWLLNNGYIQPGAYNQFCNGFSADSCGSGSNLNFALDCDSSSQGQACISGTLFCDANQNGQMDSTEMPLNNAPVHVYFNQTNFIVYTDQNGHYQYNPSFATGNSSALICLDNAWLSQHGYQASNMCDTIYDATCGNPNNTPVNFAIDCDSTSGGGGTTNGCFYGMIFCDQNQNGVYDSLENTIGGAPFTVYVGNNVYQMQADVNGYYQFTYQYDSSQTSQGQICVDTAWLIQNGYTSPNTWYPQCQSFTVGNCGPNDQIDFAIHCDTVSQSQACISGTLYCDANQNGQMDSTEMPLTNAPVNIYFNGGYMQVFTDQNGNYQYGSSFTGSNTGALVCLDYQWMTQQGYQNSYACDTVFDATCGNPNNTPVNFAIDCDSTSGGGGTTNGCFYGMIFCDQNQNGIYDSLENTIGGAPFTVYVGNNVYQMQADANGYYQFSFQYDSTQTSQGQVCVDTAWLIQNGYTSPNTWVNQCHNFSIGNCGPNDQIDFAIHCDSVSQSQACISGTLFCDDNQNGQLDSTELRLSNAPVHVYFNGTNSLVYTDQNGIYQYNSQFTGSNTGALVCLDYQWMTQHGFQANSMCDTVYDATCGNPNNTPVNFAIDCDSTSNNNACVQGNIFCDVNGNGVYDSTDLGLVNAVLYLNDQQTNATVTLFSNPNGHFSYSGPALGDSVTVYVDSAWLSTFGYNGPSSFTISTDCSQNIILNIPLDCGSSPACSDMYAHVDPWIGYYQNNVNYIKIKWGTYGPQAPGNYTLSLEYPAGVTPVTSTFNNSNYVIANNTVTWTMNSNSSSFMLTDVIGFSVPSGIPSGTPHTYKVTVMPVPASTDCHLLNNKDELTMIVGNSYDPNDKTVNHPELIDPYSTQEFTYRIRFQNTGTAPAQDVYIMDTLDANLDWSTFRILDYSHPMSVIDEGNGIIRFDFPDIWLPDSNANEPESHGYVKYTIKEHDDLPLGSAIENTAYIFFDWNPAIITNTTYNENNTLSLEEKEGLNARVYPNPANEVIHIQSDSRIVSVEVISTDGKVLIQENGVDVQNLNLHSVSSGVYLLQLRDEVGRQSVQRFQKQ